MEFTDILFQPVDLETFNFQALSDFFNLDSLVKFLTTEDNYKVFKSFVDHIENSFLMIVHTVLSIITHFLYVFRVGPVKYLNEHRKEFCLAQPAYGSEEFLHLIDQAPLAVVYCSSWFNHGLVAIEKLWIAPYVIF